MIDWSFVVTFIVAFGLYEIGKALLLVVKQSYCNWYRFKRSSSMRRDNL